MLRSLAILLLLVSQSFAQQCSNGQCGKRTVADAPSPDAPSPAAATPMPSRCRVRGGDGSVGSGTLVCCDDSGGIVITAYHVVKDSGGRIGVRFPSGEDTPGSIVASDPFYDLAAIKIEAVAIEPTPIGDDTSGELVAGGFGGDGKFRVARGRIAGYVFYNNDTNSLQMPKITGSVRPGDSGGGVVNSARQMVGVVWGELNGETYITTGKPLLEMVRQTCGNHSQNLVPVQPRPPLPPATTAPQPPTPTIDWQAKYNKLEADFAVLNESIYKLQKQCAACNCDQVKAELTAKIETLSQMQVVVNNDVKQLQAAQPSTPNYDEIAAEMQKRLTHSATVTLLDGTVTPPQIRPLDKPLEFNQRVRPKQ